MLRDRVGPLSTQALEGKAQLQRFFLGQAHCIPESPESRHRQSLQVHMGSGLGFQGARTLWISGSTMAFDALESRCFLWCCGMQSQGCHVQLYVSFIHSHRSSSLRFQGLQLSNFAWGNTEIENHSKTCLKPKFGFSCPDFVSRFVASC